MFVFLSSIFITWVFDMSDKMSKSKLCLCFPCLAIANPKTVLNFVHLCLDFEGGKKAFHGGHSESWL